MTDAERQAAIDLVAQLIAAGVGRYLDEANAAPGTEQKVAKAIVDMLLPKPEPV